MMNSKTLLTTLIAAAALGTAWACGRDSNADTGPVAEASVVVGPENIVTALADTILTGPSVSGTLDAERNATLRAELPAQITGVLVEPGTPVLGGQLLVKLDDTGIRDQYLSAQSGLRAAESAAEMAEADLARDERLFQAGALAQRQLDASRRMSLQATAALADARSRQASATLNLRRTEIRAPFPGVVATRSARVGDNVQPGTPLVTVVDPASLRLEAQVPVDQISAIRVGTAVLFTVSGISDRQFRGVVTRVSPAVDPATRQVPLVVRLPNTGGT